MRRPQISLRWLLILFTVLSVTFYVLFIRPTGLAQQFVQAVNSGDFSTLKVDAADYVVWRKNSGTTTTLPNDPIGGMIGTAHYDQWRARFGNTAGSGSMPNATVPEPAAALLTALGVVMGCSISTSIRRPRSKTRWA